MKQQLDAQIIALETKSDSVTETLGTGVFVDAHAPTDTVATEMSAAKNRLEGCRRLKNRYTDYQDLFEVGVAFQFAQFTAADETFEKRDLLWNLVSTFAESRRNWLSQDFAELDVNDVQTETEDVFMKAHKLHKKFQGDVSKKLLDSVKAFRADVPTIVELGNPSMQPEHWAPQLPKEYETITRRSVLGHLSRSGCCSHGAHRPYWIEIYHSGNSESWG